MDDKRPNGMRSNAENILRATLGEAVEYDKPNSPVEYYLVKLKEAIEAGGGGGTGGIKIKGRVNTYADLPSTAEEGDMYFVGYESDDYFTEYVYTTDGRWEKLGDTDIRLVQPDWLQSDNTAADYIKNKPTIPTMLSQLNGDSTHRTVTDSEKTTWNSKQDALSQTQLASVNSGIDSVKVEQIATNTTNEVTDRAALVEIVDSGAKNHASVNDFTATLRQIIDVTPIAGTIHLHIGSCTSTDTDTTTFLIQFHYSDGTTVDRVLTKGAIDADYNLGNYILNRIDVYASDNWTHSTGDDITVSELMICSKAAWDISQTYQPCSNYITVNGIRVYVSATAPTGARTGDLWIGG